MIAYSMGRSVSVRLRRPRQPEPVREGDHAARWQLERRRWLRFIRRLQALLRAEPELRRSILCGAVDERDK